MRKLFFSLIAGFFLSSSLHAGDDMKKGLNVVLTSGTPQTQMMAMVLSMQTLKLGKKVHMVLCSDDGNVALKSEKGVVLKPLDKTPQMLLKALIKKGADVKVCPLYLPNLGKDKSVLIDGVKEANPMKVAKKLLDEDYTILSY